MDFYNCKLKALFFSPFTSAALNHVYTFFNTPPMQKCPHFDYRQSTSETCL